MKSEDLVHHLEGGCGVVGGEEPFSPHEMAVDHDLGRQLGVRVADSEEERNENAPERCSHVSSPMAGDGWRKRRVGPLRGYTPRAPTAIAAEGRRGVLPLDVEYIGGLCSVKSRPAGAALVRGHTILLGLVDLMVYEAAQTYNSLVRLEARP